MPTGTPKIAVYWDFENLHASIVESETSEEYKPYQIQREKLLNISALMDYIYSLGDVVINRAYNDWQYYRVYKNELLFHAIDLIQLYPKGAYAKNGADIRLAMDALEDAYQNTHITHAVIIGGDSDYIAVAQKLKKLGRFVIGIGVQGTTNPFWTRSCTEFKYYETLTRKAQQEHERLDVVDEPPLTPSTHGSDLDAARELLVKAVQRLMAEDDVDAVLKAKVRPMMTRLDPGFDPANYNFQTFNAFIAACDDIIRSFKGEYDVMIALRNASANDLDAPMHDLSVQTRDAKQAPRTLSPLAGNLAIDYFLWSVQLNQINDAIKPTLSDIGVTLKLLAPDFSIQSCGYPKNNGLKSLAEDVAARGYITISYDQSSNAHYITANETLFERVRTLTVPVNIRSVRCIRIMSKLYLFLRYEDILFVFHEVIHLFEAVRSNSARLTVENLFTEVVHNCSNSGHHPKKLQKILERLLDLGIFATETDGIATLNDQCEIAEIVCRDDDELITRYIEFVQRQLSERIGEEYPLPYLRSLFLNAPIVEGA